jgi:hypothetical protein
MKEESSFSEEKEAKRLLFWRSRQDPVPFLKRWVLDRGSGGELKVFWFFSSEKNTFLSYCVQGACPAGHCAMNTPLAELEAYWPISEFFALMATIEVVLDPGTRIVW